MTIGQRKIKPGWLTAAGGTVLGLAIAGTALFSTALAVHNAPFPFELDGNVKQDGTLDDWQNVFELNGVLPPGTGTPHATGAEVFLRDLPSGGGGKETQYDAGKDTLDLSGWTRKDVTKVTPDKDNITDAFAKQYMVDHDNNPATPDHRVVYFGADRLANNGDAALGFWFFQRHVDLTGSNGFSPVHTRHTATQRGDILIQADFVSGGSDSQIHIYEWYGTGGNVGGSLQLIAMADANGNTVCLSGDAACATTNETITGSYWPYTPKFGTAGRFPTESFFEGGIDLTALVGDICFNSFLANTRTSHSETADLKDLALGDFNTCGSIQLVKKECMAQTNVSPVYMADSELYQTKHQLTILNDGMGSNVFDVGVRDNSVGGDNLCKIVYIDAPNATGLPSITLPAGIPFPNNSTFIKLADTLAPGVANQMTVTLLCTSPLPLFANSASIRAGQTAGGTSLTDDYAESSADTAACAINVPTGLVLTKSCPTGAVVLDSSNGYKPKVCVDITLQNTGQSKIDITSLMDEHADGSAASNLLSQVGTSPYTIDPGDTVSNIRDCYTPTGPDSAQTDPDLAGYSDTVKASGHPHTAAAGVTIDASETSATCLLCPGTGK